MYTYHINNKSTLTHLNFIATSLNPLSSNRLMIFPTSPLCTPSGFTIIKLLSLFAAIAFENNEKNASKVPIIQNKNHY